MKLPSKVNLFSVEYIIDYVKNEHECDIDGQDKLAGQISYHEASIRVVRKEDSNKSMVFKTLMHELIHAITRGMCIDEITSHEQHEAIVDRLAVGFTELLLRNKWIELE